MKKLKIDLLSIVVPVYGCKNIIRELHKQISEVLYKHEISFELLFVNDGSLDDAWPTILELSSEYSVIKGINLSRNFGQHHAIAAGLDAAVGNWVVVMDCDLQDSPKEIIRFIEKASEGYDLVVGVRRDRKEKFINRVFSSTFYRVARYLSGMDISANIGNFGLYSRQVINSIQSMRESGRPFGLMAVWVGYSRAEIFIEHASRHSGESSYNFLKLLRLATVSFVSFSDKLIITMAAVGFFVAAVSFFVALFFLCKYLFFGVNVEGWLSLAITILFSTGLIISSIGIIGIYLARVYSDVKQRPLYIVKDTTKN